MTFDEAATEVARLFGFRSTSTLLKQIIQDEVNFLLEYNVVNQKNDRLYINDAATVAESDLHHL